MGVARRRKSFARRVESYGRIGLYNPYVPFYLNVADVKLCGFFRHQPRRSVRGLQASSGATLSMAGWRRLQVVRLLFGADRTVVLEETGPRP